MIYKPEFSSPENLRFGRSPALDAWLLHFMTENNLEYAIDPDKNASPEQIRFMVDLQDEEHVYAPCSDRRLPLLLTNTLEPDLEQEYNEKWMALTRLVREFVPYRKYRKQILLLCAHKFKQVKTSTIIIPSRLIKRLITIFLIQSGHTNPYRQLKIDYNKQAHEALNSKEIDTLLNICPDEAQQCRRLSEFRFQLDMIELTRLIILSTMEDIWKAPDHEQACRKITSQDLCDDNALSTLTQVFDSQTGSKKILYMPDTSGGLMFDLLIIRALLRQGHKVTLALKEGFYFESPSFWDWDDDTVLSEALEGAHFIENDRMSKNELLQAQREHQFTVITDGTREELNLYRTSVTFARAWKEADLIVAKGEPNYRRLIRTSHQFTRDILSIRRTEAGFSMHHKPRPEHIRKFSEAQLLDKADEMIQLMRRAKREGRSVMFYSAVIGSIPGQTKTALQVVNAFVGYLRERLEATFIINPAEHFEEGMDADDLMYMWERVQRSGLIDIWRFQTFADIEKSFDLMDRKVPPIWAGKDSTFSTGCTKEMRIALDMQRLNPEMQLIGPSPSRFFRRSEYGVGKFSDEVLG